MKTQAFNAIIKTVQYREVQSKQNEILYIANCEILERGRGRLQTKNMDNAKIYLTKEQYEQQPFGVGDKIRISENCKWVRTPYSINVYNREKLANYPANKLKKDKMGKTYAVCRFIGYSLSCPIGEVTIVEKADEICYIQVDKVKFYITEDSIDYDFYCIFFGKDIFEKLSDVNNKVIAVRCYLHKNIKWTTDCEIQSAFDKTSNKYFANIIKKGE